MKSYFGIKANLGAEQHLHTRARRWQKKNMLNPISDGKLFAEFRSTQKLCSKTPADDVCLGIFDSHLALFAADIASGGDVSLLPELRARCSRSEVPQTASSFRLCFYLFMAFRFLSASSSAITGRK